MTSNQHFHTYSPVFQKAIFNLMITMLYHQYLLYIFQFLCIIYNNFKTFNNFFIILSLFLVGVGVFNYVFINSFKDFLKIYITKITLMNVLNSH
jgi:hypothetical protein